VDEKRKGKQRLGFAEPQEYLGEVIARGERSGGQLSRIERGRGGPVVQQGTIDTSASDISVYTSAVALHGTAQKRPDRSRGTGDEQYLLRSSGSGLQHTISTTGNDQGSILSGSSLYATAASLSSGSDHGAGSGTVQWGCSGAEGGVGWDAGELGIPLAHYAAKSLPREARVVRKMTSDGEEEFLESPV